ncbi:TRAFs-binding domain-containing protein [Salinibacter altiplanensis]|uniref:TRAFs-binding domain-containing protein n=1 Tax=Salinibacter altiplanensis TaxID=1803181 RepID=UPI001319E329|nr:TRAFs-binding domain-containing protein [Salinibacter altiplanensis]
MPFGEKSDPGGEPVKFDSVYQKIIRPAVERVDLSPIRADEERLGGTIHRAMFERLLFSSFAVVDLTVSNANVLYELGTRHANRPWSTLLIRKKDARLPFNVQDLRTVSYTLSSEGEPTDVDEAIELISSMLAESKQRVEQSVEGLVDSPLFEFFPDYPEIDVSTAQTFEAEMDDIQAKKERIAEAEEDGVDALRDHHESLYPIVGQPGEVVTSLFFAYRALEGWSEMVDLFAEMPASSRNSISVQEQYAMALNRCGRHDDAETKLRELIDEHGPSGETYGHLGRVYKDLWKNARDESKDHEANAYLNQSIEVYLKGFEADLNDIYPGINAATLMKIRDPKDEKADQILTVVEYATKQDLETDSSSYWPHATLLEIQSIRRDEEAARSRLGRVLTEAEESWQLGTTADNLSLLRDARADRGQPSGWLGEIITALNEKGNEL